MSIDSTADLLFRIGANTDDGEANIERFRALLGKDLADLSAEFSDWSTRVFGDLSTVQGAMTAMAAASAAGVVALASGLMACAHEYSNYVEEVERGSRATGISIENMSGLHLMAEETGVSYDSLVRGLTRFASTIVKAAHGGEQQMKMFHALGISQEQVKAGENDMLPLLELVMDRFKQMGPSVLSSASAREAFGRGAIDLARFLAMGGDALRDYIHKTEEMGTQVHRADVESLEGFKAQIKLVTSYVHALGIRVGRFATEELSKLMAGLTGFSVMLYDLPALVHGFDAFNKQWLTDIKAIGAEIRKVQDAMSQEPKPGGSGGDDRVAKTKEDYRGLSELLSEIKTKMADLAGPEAKAADEARVLEEHLAKAIGEYQKRIAAGEMLTDAAKREMQALVAAGSMLPQLIASMAKKAGDAVVAAVAETGAQLRTELLKQGPQTLAVKQTEWAAEIEARRAKIVEQGKRDATDESANLQLLHELYVAGARKIADDGLRERLKGNADLAAEVAAQTEQTFKARREAWNRHIADEVDAYVKEGHTVEAAEERFAAARKAGLVKIAAEEKAAYDAEMARLGEQLERINREHQTAVQRIAAEYQADAARWSAIEEKKTLATATGEAERVRISWQFLMVREGLLKKEQEDLQKLHNSQGWKGVFGAEFGQMIRRNDDLLKEWQSSTNQSLMMVRVALEGMKEEVQDAFQKMAQGMGSAAMEAFIYRKNVKAAMEEALKSTLASLAGMAATHAIYSLALGFFRLANREYDAAAQAFTAAAIFGSVAAVAAIAGRALPSGSSGGSGGGDSGSSRASSGGSGADSSEGGAAGTAASGSGARHVTVNVYGHVYGTSGVAELCGMINNAVMEGGTTLTATNTTTGRQVQQ